MNLKFKRSLIVALAFASFYSFGNECSTLSFSRSADGSKLVELIAVDTEYADNVDNYNRRESRQLIDGKATYYFKPGSYSLLVKIWDLDFFKVVYGLKPVGGKYKRARYAYRNNRMSAISIKRAKFAENEAHIAEFVKEVPLAINIEQNKAYQLSLVSDNKAPLFSVAAKELKQCEPSTKQVFEIKSRNVTSVDRLPEATQRNIKRMVSKLANYQMEQGLDTSNVVPTGYYQHIGAYLEKEIIDNRGFQVLWVHPYSFAHNIGLASGDIVTKFGDKESKNIEEPNFELADYIRSKSLEDKIPIEVIRNGQTIHLSSSLALPLVPQSSFSIRLEETDNKNELINRRPFPSKLQLEYDRLILEVMSHFPAQLVENNLKLVGKPFQSKHYGFKGKLEKVGNSIRLIVTDVEPGQTADRIGIIVGDKVVKINGEVTHNEKTPFLEQVSAMIDGQKHEVEILRNGQPITLVGHTIYRQYSGYEIDLLSIEKIKGLAVRKPGATRWSNRLSSLGRYQAAAPGDGSHASDNYGRGSN